MRELERSVARTLMNIHGIKQINKKKFQEEDRGKKSYFALHWRDYLNPKSDQRKDLRRRLERAAIRMGVKL